MTELKEYFQQRYQGRQSFLDHVIFPIFGEESFDDGYDQDVLASYPELNTVAQATGIASVLNVGTIDVDFNPISIFDITVSSHTLLSRNRVGIQQIIRRIMSTYSSAFMIFHYQDNECWDWRFTFCSKAKNNEVTDNKRYTFMLGPNQSCRTVADNFTKLMQKGGEIELKDIQEAFDVEALSDEFFGKYKQHYERFVEYVTGKRFVKKGQKWVETKTGEPHPQMYADFGCNDKRVRDYVKKLLGRIVFLHFLQKKGWMGVPEGKPWGEGDPQFMLHLYEQASAGQQADFLDSVLEPLFAGGLDTDRSSDDDLFDTQVALPYGSRVKVPYLNGGLFERDALDEIPTQFPAEFFRDLLDFLYQYNFTIDENDPDDAQVGVDPEMLGRIFENLLEDNKDKGAYYTPKEIVRYMCRQSLIAYLNTGVSNKEQQKAVEDFVRSYDVAVLGGADSPLAQTIDEKLKNVKICDPAIGSGAFPMGLLKELFLCRGAIENFDNAAEIKRHIIQQNIYGVDIERGAIDIARLRFWLSLVVDEETPHTLPNLDFKIMQGNSLLEQYQGVDLSDLDYKRKKKEKVVMFDLFDSDADYYRKMLSINKEYYFSCDDHDKKIELRKNITDAVKKQLTALNYDIDWTGIDLMGNDQFFLWHTWFDDVFNRPSGCNGFDIVIGNPPYVQISTNDREMYSHYPALEGHIDLYELFVLQGNFVLKRGGVLCYIIPNTILSNLYSKQLRKMLIDEFGLCEITNFGMNVFVDQVVHTCILRMHKGEKLREIGVKRCVKSYNEVDKKFDYYLCVDDIEATENYTFDISLNDRERSLFNKLNRNEKLGDICYIRQCIKTGNDKEYVISSKTTMPYPWKKTLKGKGMERYLIREGDLYLKYGNWLARNWSNKDFYERPKIAIRETGKRITACLDNENRYFLSSLYACYPKADYTLLDLKFLLGILNSTLATYYISKIAFDLSQGAFTKMRTNQLARLPIPQCDSKNELGELVDKIADEKYKNTYNDINSLETQIDNIVYHLYGLTYDEVLIVDSNTPISRKEYELYNITL